MCKSVKRKVLHCHNKRIDYNVKTNVLEQTKQLNSFSTQVGSNSDIYISTGKSKFPLTYNDILLQANENLFPLRKSRWSLEHP